MSILASIRGQLVPVNREGYPFIGGFALASLILSWFWTPLGWLGVILTVWCVLFFRDPQRVTPVREGVIVAPADGRIRKIIHAAPPSELGLGERPLLRVSIFMSVFDCHVNRSPVSGRIEKIVYKPGAVIRRHGVLRRRKRRITRPDPRKAQIRALTRLIHPNWEKKRWMWRKSAI